MIDLIKGLGESFWGSMIGTVISGAVAIFVMRRQIIFQRKLAQKISYQEYLKEAHTVEMHLEALIDSTKLFCDVAIRTDNYLGKPEYEKDIADNYYFAGDVFGDMERSMNVIYEADRRYILHEIYPEYIGIISFCRTTIEYFGKKFISKDAHGTSQFFPSAIDELEKTLVKLRNHSDKIEKELEKLKV